LIKTFAIITTIVLLVGLPVLLKHRLTTPSVIGQVEKAPQASPPRPRQEMSTFRLEFLSELGRPLPASRAGSLKPGLKPQSVE
jgi:hypothetical protein